MKPAKILPLILQLRTSPCRVNNVSDVAAEYPTPWQTHHWRRRDSCATSIPINDVDAVDGERLLTVGNVVRLTS